MPTKKKRKRPHETGWNYKRFTELREEFGERVALAAVCGVGEGAVRKWEQEGSYGPYARTLKLVLVAFAERFDKTITEVFDELTVG